MAERTLTVKIIGDASSLEHSFNRASRSSAAFEAHLGKATRGALAGSGAFQHLGRSIAFASGGFLAFASVGDFFRKSIDAAKEAQVTQAQLAAQFRASGRDVAAYQKAIDRTANRLSLLSGFENDQLKEAFTTIFRTTDDVSRSLRDLATAADLARAKHLDLNQAALIIAKTEAGNTTLLRRQGFQIAKNASAEEALAELRQRVAGQARAGTTAQERFGAALHNTEEIIGSALLPTLNKYLDELSVWLTKMNESGKLERDVAKATHDLGVAFDFTAAAIGKASGAYKGFVQFANDSRSKGGLLGGLGEALRVLAVPGVGLQDAIKLLKGAGIIPTSNTTVKDLIKGNEQLFQSNLFGQPVIDTSKGFNVQFFQKATAAVDRLQKAAAAIAIPSGASGSVATPGLLRLPGSVSGTAATPGLLHLPRARGSFQFLADQFTLPLRLQLEAAKAAAQGKDLVPILKREKAAALKALESGKLATQAQIDAWNQITSINDQLKGAVNKTRFRHVSVSKLLQSISGLTIAQKKQLEQVSAQIGAGGTLPPQASLAFSSAGAVVVHSDLYLDGKKVAQVTKKHDRKSATRRVTPRRGPWAGRT